MTQALHGVIHGRTIELDRDPGIEHGRVVEVVLRMQRLPGPPPAWKPGSTETAAGSLAESWTDEDDRIFQEIYEARKRSSRPEIVE